MTNFFLKNNDNAVIWKNMLYAVWRLLVVCFWTAKSAIHNRPDCYTNPSPRHIMQSTFPAPWQLYSLHIFRISARGSEDNIYNKYYRRLEPSVQADHEEQAVIHKWWQPAQNVVFSVAKDCRTLDAKMSKLGCSFKPVIDNIWDENTCLICPRE